jgi:hypothetical protein
VEFASDTVSFGMGMGSQLRSRQRYRFLGSMALAHRSPFHRFR